MIEVKQYTDIKKGRRYLPFDLNTNSKIYVNGLELTKIPKKHILFGSRQEKLLKYIDARNIKSCVEIKKLIYKENRLVAYTIKFYKDHKSLRKLLRKKIELKKQDCLKIEQAFNELSKNNLQIIDYNLSNILLDKNQNVIICDLESLDINESEKVKIINNKNLFVLVLSYIYKIPTSSVEALLKNLDGFLINDNNILFEVFERVKNGEQIEVKELLNLISEKDVKVKRRILKRSVSELKRNPYFNKYF